MLRNQNVHTIRDLAAQGQSIRAIAEQTGIARNTVRKYLRGLPVAAPRPRRTSKLEPFKERIRRWIHADRLLNCQTMLERLRAAPDPRRWRRHAGAGVLPGPVCQQPGGDVERGAPRPDERSEAPCLAEG